MDKGVEMISTRILIACILLTQVAMLTVMADNSLNNSNHFWIKINPVPQSYIGETINITGTTNLPEDEKLEVKGIADQEYQYRIKSGVISEQHPWYTLKYEPWWIFNGECKIVGNTTIKEFQCLVNSAQKSPELHKFIVFSPNAIANSTLIIKNRWLKFDAFEQNVSVGEVFSVSGTTNAPEGARLDLVIFGDKSNWMNPAGFPCIHCITLQTNVMKSNQSTDTGTFSFVVNTSELNPGENEIWLYESDEFWGNGFTESSLSVNPQTQRIAPINPLTIDESWIFGILLTIVGLGLCLYIISERKR
jgi:hypothetical protein